MADGDPRALRACSGSVRQAPGSDPGAPLRGGVVALRAVFGQDEANHGVVRYRVGNDGLVWVPREAVEFLISKGGFVVAKTTTGPILASGEAGAPGSTQGLRPSVRATLERPAGMVKLHHDNAAGCSYDGRQYPGDENGDVLVPAAAASELLAHGFALVPQPPSAPKPSKPWPRAKLSKG